MKILASIFLLLSILVSSQNQRFVYEYSFKMDSLNRDKVEKELMNLDVSKDGSYFYSALLIARDSLFKAEFKKANAAKSMVLDMRKIKQSKVNFRISKTYPSFETVYHSMLNATNLAVKEVDKIKWIVLSETKTIEKFKAQKATATFGDRNWIAWFTNDIQIQDGPYKFCGLPGLILTIEDDKGDHQFRFAGNQKIEHEQGLMDSKMKEIFVTKEKFNFLWNEYKKDPAKNIKLIHSSSQMSETLFYNANNGSPMSKQDLIEGKEERAAESFKKNNNFIEVALYK